MATEARPMIRQRRMGSCMRSGAVVGEGEGESRCGARVAGYVRCEDEEGGDAAEALWGRGGEG